MIVLRQKSLESGNGGCLEAVERIIGEAAEHQVHLAGATPPTADPEPAQPELARVAHVVALV